MINNNEQTQTRGNLTNRYIAYCGNDCTVCPQYQKSWSEGCLGNTPANYCGTCAVRRCNLEKQNANCAYCEKYPCKILEKQYENMKTDGYSEWAAMAKTALDAIRKM
jgi:hypothetical protein